MITDISLKKGSGIPSSLNFGEPAIDTDGKVLYVGIDENGGSNYAKFIDETEIDKKIVLYRVIQVYLILYWTKIIKQHL